jgi:stage II sporulation protein D
LNSANSKLGKLVDGSLEGINVVRRGVSPRVIQAQVVGSAGSTTVTGATLQSDLGTPSTWMSFTTVSAAGIKAVSTVSAPAQTEPAATSTTTTTATPTPASGGVGLTAALRGHLLPGQTYAVTGTIFPAVAGATVTVQLQIGRSWTSVTSGSLAASGGYSIPVPTVGTYRVLYNGIDGPTISVR